MRLYDTFTRSLVELPPAAGADPDVLLRPDRVRARARRKRTAVRGRDVAAVVVARDRLRGDARPQHHRHQRQDLRRRPGRERRARRAGDRVVPARTPATSGSACRTHLPKATESVPQIVAFIEELIEGGHAYPVQGDVYFRVSRFPEYGRLSGQRPDQVEEQEPNPLKEDGRDFALWKANKPETEDTWWDSPWGRGRPGLAHRVLSDGCRDLRPGLRDPRRRARPRLPTPRERGRAVAVGRPSVRVDLDAQRDAPVHRREDVEVARQRDDAA